MLSESVCRRCFLLCERRWEEEDWKNGCVFCPPEIVARRISDPPIHNLLGTVFGMTEISEIPAHCPNKHEHLEVTA